MPAASTSTAPRSSTSTANRRRRAVPRASTPKAAAVASPGSSRASSCSKRLHPQPPLAGNEPSRARMNPFTVYLLSWLTLHGYPLVQRDAVYYAAKAESALRTDAVSPRGNVGLFQLNGTRKYALVA